MDSDKLWLLKPEVKRCQPIHVICMNKLTVQAWWLRTGPADYLAVPESLVYQPTTSFISSGSRTGTKTSCLLSCSNMCLCFQPSTHHSLREISVCDKDSNALSLEILSSQISQTHRAPPSLPGCGIKPGQDKHSESS